MAHIGVLKYLEELGIPVDIVVGTSIGSIVDGLYSLGYSADQLDSLVQAQDWDFLISDRYKRSMLTYREKKEGEQYLVSIPFKNAESFSEGFENKQEKSGKQAEMFRNTPIFRLSTPGCSHSLHPDVRDGYTRMHRVFSY